MKTDVVYFELNNWFADRDSPASEPFMSWMKNDMSRNFLITASRVWAESECPELLSKYKEFLPYSEDNIGVQEVDEPYQ